MTKIDETTGLPELPKGFSWSIQRDQCTDSLMLMLISNLHVSWSADNTSSNVVRNLWDMQRSFECAESYHYSAQTGKTRLVDEEYEDTITHRTGWFKRTFTSEKTYKEIVPNERQVVEYEYEKYEIHAAQEIIVFTTESILQKAESVYEDFLRVLSVKKEEAESAALIGHYPPRKLGAAHD